MMNTLARYKWVIVILVLEVAVYLVNQSLGMEIARRSRDGIIEMLSFVPPVFVLLGLLDIWVPREKVIAHLGPASGVMGAGLATFLGAAAAGPLYGAFPVAAVMLKKGASFYNIMIFVGAWSTLKIPMFLFESQYLGIDFAATRWILSLAGIVLIARLVNTLLPETEQKQIYAKHSETHEAIGKRNPSV